MTEQELDLVETIDLVNAIQRRSNTSIVIVCDDPEDESDGEHLKVFIAGELHTATDMMYSSIANVVSSQMESCGEQLLADETDTSEEWKNRGNN